MGVQVLLGNWQVLRGQGGWWGPLGSFQLVPEEGLEPSRTCVRQILSLLRLPLRHSGRASLGAGEGNRTLVSSLEGSCSAIELRPLFQTNG